MDFFKKNNDSLEERLSYSDKLKLKYPDLIPVIIDKRKGDKILQDIDKKKYLIPKNLMISDVLFIIRKKITISENQAIFIFVNNLLVPMNTTIGEVYNTHKSEDNFLYFVYTAENTFG